MTQFAAERPDQMPTFEDMTSMSGLEFLQAIRAGRIPGAPIAIPMNFWIDRVEDGIAVFRGRPEFSALNPMGVVHGGWYGTLLDSAMGCAVMTRVPARNFYTTLEYKVNIVRSLQVGTEVIVEGRVQHAGRTTGVAMGEMRGAEDGRLYASGTTTCIIMPVPA